MRNWGTAWSRDVVEVADPGNKLGAEHRGDLWEQLVEVELGEPGENFLRSALISVGGD